MADGWETRGARIGSRVGGGLGRLAHKSKKLRRIVGTARKAINLLGGGDYELAVNSLFAGGGVTEDNLQIVPAGPREVRIVYKEYLGDVYSSTTANGFKIDAYPINPGLVGTFPWLANIAQQFDQWQPNGIVFEFKSSSSEYSTSSALGSVLMATEYDSLDSPYTTKMEMMNSAYANEAKISSPRILHGVECAREETPTSILYTRGGAIPASGDLNTYDLGVFYIGSIGVPNASTNLGSLYVHYDITFRKEQLFNGPLMRGALWSGLQFSGCTDAARLNTLVSRPTTTGLKDPTLPAYQFNNGTIAIPPGFGGCTFMFVFNITGTASATWNGGAIPTLTNMTLIDRGSGSGVNYSSGTAGVTDCLYVATATVNRNDLISTIAPLWTGMPGSATVKASIFQISDQAEAVQFY